MCRRDVADLGRRKVRLNQALARDVFEMGVNMTPIDLMLCADCVVRGALYDTLDPIYLIDDLLEVDLPSGDTVSVEWDKESARFVIVVFRDDWENRLQTIHATAPLDVRDSLRRLLGHDDGLKKTFRPP